MPTREELDSPPQPHIRRLQEVPKLAAGAAVLVITARIAAHGVPDWEVTLFEKLNRIDGRIEPVLWAPMQLGSLFGPPFVAMGSWIAWKKWRPTAGALVVGIGAWQSAKIVKNVIQRPRPGDYLTEIVRRSGTPSDGLGFISGHSAVAFALAAIVSPYLCRRDRVLAYTLAGLVAFARIHVGAHFPLDTVGGAGLGICLAYGYHLVVGVPIEGN